MVAGRVPVVLVLVLVLVNRGRSFNGPAPAVKSRRELFSALETDPARATEPFEHETSTSTIRSASPQTTVESPILDGFTEMICSDLVRAGQVGNGTRNFQNPIISARAQIQVAHRFAN